MENVRTIFCSSFIVYHPSSIVYFAAGVLLLFACPALGIIEFKDGLTHDINYQIDNDVYVDWQAPDMFTTVNWLAGGRLDNPCFLEGYEDSRINIRGGYIWELYSRGSSQVNISGGLIDGYVQSTDSSQVDISGGLIYGLVSVSSSQVNISGGLILHLSSNDSSQVDISGGSVGGNLYLSDNSTIRIFGSDFEVDGYSTGYGEITSILGSWPENEPLRHLTGTLLSGELMDNGFRIGQNARIILIPEPATITLLSIGVLLLRRKHNG